jgi:uncharacterized protein YjbI with pentapeptide repeats
MFLDQEAMSNYNRVMPSPFLPLQDVYDKGERNFQRFYLHRAQLQDSFLQEIDLSGADLTSANLQGADLAGATLKGVLLNNANLKFARLTKADLSAASLSCADLEGADLTGAVFSRANLQRANFQSANLTGAHLVGVDGDGELAVSIDHRSIFQRTSFREAVMRGANLSEANLRYGNFQGADLREARLLRADLSEIDGSPVQAQTGPAKLLLLDHADLSFASLRKSKIMGNFRTTNLSQVDFREAAIVGDFHGADLSGALFWKTILSGSDLTSSKLTGTNLRGCKLNKCLMPNGKPAGWDVEKFCGDPPSPSAKGVIRRPPVYTEFWFDEYEQIRSLRWPSMCVCCCRSFERYERLTLPPSNSTHRPLDVSVPFCTACLQHHTRSSQVKNWMKTMCTAQGGKTPALKFERRAKGILAGKLSFVLSFSSMEYAISFSGNNQIPFRGSRNNFPSR